MLRAQVFASALLAAVLWVGEGQARDLAVPQENPGEAMMDLKAISRWFAARFPGSGAQAFRIEDLRIESHACGCDDKPIAHFPYRVVLVSTPKADLVARPEGQEGVAGIVPLAVRYGDRYCALESDEQCYGSFAHPCEFTDFRYGPALAAFFPTCKAGQPTPGASPGDSEHR
jgi:hypothetical protein